MKNVENYYFLEPVVGSGHCDNSRSNSSTHFFATEQR